MPLGRWWTITALAHTRHVAAQTLLAPLTWRGTTAAAHEAAAHKAAAHKAAAHRAASLWSQVEYLARVMKKWARENGVNT